jgi:hypothetical protein
MSCTARKGGEREEEEDSEEKECAGRLRLSPRPAGGSGPGRASPYTALSSTFIPLDRHERPDANHGDVRLIVMCFLSQHRQFVGPSAPLSVPYDITSDLPSFRSVASHQTRICAAANPQYQNCFSKPLVSAMENFVYSGIRPSQPSAPRHAAVTSPPHQPSRGRSRSSRLKPQTGYGPCSRTRPRPLRPVSSPCSRGQLTVRE